MKTHMNKTDPKNFATDVCAHTEFINHQKSLHSGVKPLIDNKHK